MKQINMEETAAFIADAMLDKKAQNVVSLDLTSLGTAIADYFIICNADSTTAVAAIAENVLDKMENERGKKVLRMQGLENQLWVILDYGDIVAHIFQTQYRDFYKLESLWADMPRREYADEPARRPEAQAKERSESARKSKSSSKVKAAAKKITEK